MALKIGEKLYQLRKKNGYSQDEIAEKLNVSRQSVSKWERDESYPDLDNLVALSKLFNISLDSLLDLKEETTVENNEETKEIIIEDKIDPEKQKEIDEKSENRKATIKMGNLASSIMLGFLFLAVLLALIVIWIFEPKYINYVWPLFFACPILPSIIDCITHHRFCRFGIVFCSLLAFFICGMYFNIWHPSWVAFLAIPVYYTIGGMLDKVIKYNENK